MPQAIVEVVHAEGLHARPAAEFVKLANTFRSTVRVGHAGREVNGKSILGILTLGISQGTTVVVTVDGEDETVAFDALCQFLSERVEQ